MKKNLFFMSMMLVLLIVSCDTAPKPVTDATGILTVEATEQGNKLSIAFGEDTDYVAVYRERSNEDQEHNYMSIWNSDLVLKKGVHTFIDEFVEKDVPYSYKIRLSSSSLGRTYSEEVQLKAVGGKGEFTITNKPKLSYDSSINTFTLSEAPSYSNSGLTSSRVYFMFTLEGITYADMQKLINNRFDLSNVNESLYDKELYVKGIQGEGYEKLNGVTVGFNTSNVLDSSDLGFTGPFTIKKPD